ncbi:unnamed protein product [Blepharisma stoltei]|uniref:Plant heme peroxidase family profile domain-containing protein n=1 Tax=Blepharisma stoltei TaxID=1481888 RepID=A0AAU9K771_9CILI|nr:unnamed protein product [Blepharisma stoltei]
MLKESLKTVRKLQSNSEVYTQIANSFQAAFARTPLPLYLRIAFHDAGTFDKFTNTGGPNGSILNATELARDENKGISTVKDVYLNIKTSFPSVSLADIIQIGGYVSVSASGGPVMPFRFGRADCTASTADTDGRIPDPSSKNVRAIFRSMGFNDIETVALSGAHTLGGLRFVGPQLIPFTNQPLVFSNKYYQLLLQAQQQGLARLISDSFLVMDPALLAIVQSFANNNDLFFSEYSKAHVKLSELGYH